MSRAADEALDRGRRPGARPGERGRRSPGVTLALIVAALAVALATLVGPTEARRDAPRLDVVRTSGGVTIENSKEGLPIVSMSNMAPGETASGEVTLENTGTVRGYFYLAPQDLVSDPGPGGGVLSEHLIVRVYLDKGGATSRKYGGLLSKMGTVKAGRYRPGETGTYTFDAFVKDTGIPPPPTLSRPVRGDNKGQGSSASVTFGWAPTA